MRKTFKQFRKGFTLVELIVVIAIISVLASVTAVSYIAFITTANESSDIQKVEALNKLIKNDEILNEYEILTKDKLFETFHNHDVKEENVKNNRDNSSLYFSLNLQEVLYYVGTEIKFPANLEDFSVNEDDFYFNSTEYRRYIDDNYPEESTSSGGVQFSDPIAPPPSESSSEQPITDDGTTWDVSYEIPESLEPVEYNPGVKETITTVEPKNHDGKTLFIDNEAEFLYVFNCSSWLLEDTYDEIKLRADLDLKFNEGYMNLDTFSNTNKLSTVHTIPLTINGNNKTIRNLDNESGSLIGVVKYKYVLEIKNVTFYNCNFGSDDANYAGIAGKLDNGTAGDTYSHSVTFNNVRIENCNFNAKDASAPFVGYVYHTFELHITSDCRSVNNKVYSAHAMGAKIIGLLENNNNHPEKININTVLLNGVTIVKPDNVIDNQYSDYDLKDSSLTYVYTDYVTERYSILEIDDKKYLFQNDIWLHFRGSQVSFNVLEGDLAEDYSFHVLSGSSGPKLTKSGQSSIQLENGSLGFNENMFLHYKI